MACASCQGRTSEVMNFGDVALAGAFLRQEDFRKERNYPLSLEFCETCFLLQVGQSVKPESLFSHYFYFVNMNCKVIYINLNNVLHLASFRYA
jgi:hypothetical protein